MTQRDGMGREEGGGFRMGNTCIPVADSFWYLAKLKQFVKFKNKIKLKKNNSQPNCKERSKIISVCRWNKSTENSKDATKISMEIQ